MDYNFPTAADYAQSVAQDAKRENTKLALRVKDLEDRLKRLEKLVLRARY